MDIQLYCFYHFKHQIEVNWGGDPRFKEYEDEADDESSVEIGSLRMIYGFVQHFTN